MDGNYYLGALLDWPILEVTYDGSTSQYVQAGSDLITLLIVITGSYTVNDSDNPFLAGYINLGSKIQLVYEGGIQFFDFGDFQYAPDYRTEYISINRQIDWTLYRCKGNSCVLPAESYYDGNDVYLADGIRCITGDYNLTFANLRDVLEKLGLDATVTVSDIDDVGCVWSYEFNS